MISVEKRIDDLIARLEDLFSENLNEVPLTEQEIADIQSIKELRILFDISQDLSVEQLLKLNKIAERNLPK